MKMKMKDPNHYYPVGDKQILDIVCLALFISLTVIYTGVVFGKIIHSYWGNSSGPKSDGYELTSSMEREENMLEDMDKKIKSLERQLAARNRASNGFLFVCGWAMAGGLYLGYRSVGYGMLIASRGDDPHF